MSILNFHTIWDNCAVVFDDGSVKVRGRNDTGSLIVGHEDRVDDWTLMQLSGVKQVSLGHALSAVLLSDGTLQVMESGVLSDAGLTDVTHVVCARGVVLAALADGTVQGKNPHGPGISSNPVILAGVDLGTANIYGDLGISDVVHVAVLSVEGMYAVKSDGTLWTATQYEAWADTGLTDVSKVIADPTGAAVFAIHTDGSMSHRGSYGYFGTGVMASAPEWESNPLTDVKDVFPCEGATVAIKNDGSVWATGLNTNGYLGDGTTEERLSWVRSTALDNIQGA